MDIVAINLQRPLQTNYQFVYHVLGKDDDEKKVYIKKKKMYIYDDKQTKIYSNSFVLGPIKTAVFPSLCVSSLFSSLKK